MSGVARRRVYPDNPELSSFARDVDERLAGIVRSHIIPEFTREYAEPMTIAWPGKEPSGVLLIRCRNDATPEETVAGNCFVNFTFTNKGIVIPELDGPFLGTRYRFTFKLEGV